MKVFNSIVSWFFKQRIGQVEEFINYPIETQDHLFQELIPKGKRTSFGVEHHFDSINTYQDYQERVPIRNYEALYPYINRIMTGEQYVLWPNRIGWFAKSSGTTSGKSKFIPVSKETLEECHFKAGKDLLTMYFNNNPDSKLFCGKSLIMGGSHQINELDHNTKYGDVSAVMMQNMPLWTQMIRTPELKIALLDEWEEKLNLMVQTTLKQDITSISGVPTWTLVLLKQALEETGYSSVDQLWPNLELYIHGGVNFSPYEAQFGELIQSPNMKYYQVYNASEGCFGVQMANGESDMLLMLDYGIFYEFIPKSQLDEEFPQAITLQDVEVGEQYALVITTNSGLWRYKIGDIIEFTSVYPFKIKVAGRTKSFINAFGEEVMVGNTDQAIEMACAATGAQVKEYTAGPIYFSSQGQGAHEWVVEFEVEPNNLDDFIQLLDQSLQQINTDYQAKRHKNIALKQLQLHKAPRGTFNHWLKEKGKLGGQNKVPRLSNNREILDEFLDILKTTSLA